MGGLQKLDVLVAQLESMVVAYSSQQQFLNPLICFDLLSDLLSTIQDETKESILLCQRKCEDALQNLLLCGVRPPVRRLACSALLQIIQKGDTISIYARASSIQGWLSDNKKVEPACYIGAAQCLGTLYRFHGQKIASGLMETINIVSRLIKFPEALVRKAAMQLLLDALQGCGGTGPISAYTESLKIISKLGALDKSGDVRALSADCLHAFAVGGGSGLGVGGLDNYVALCMKGLEDPAQPVRDGFAAAFGALLALGLNPDGHIAVPPKGKAVPFTGERSLEGGLQRHLMIPFMKVSGIRSKDIRVGLAMAWVAFLQGMHSRYLQNDVELINFGLQALSMLSSSSKDQVEPHSQACVLYILRVGIVEQMGEPAQKEFTNVLSKQLAVVDNSASMLVVILRTLSHLLVTLGEVSLASREALDNSLVQSLSHPAIQVRVEAALTLRALAEVDPTCANGVMSCGVTTLWALREIVAVEKGERLKIEMDSLHGQAAMLSALLASSPKLVLGLPSRLPLAILDVGKKMALQPVRNPFSAAVEKEAGWMLIAAFLTSMPKEELQEQELDIIALWTVPFSGNINGVLKQAEGRLQAEISGWAAAIEALSTFISSYVVPQLSEHNEGILLQPVLGYLSGALDYLSSTALQQQALQLQSLIDVFKVKTLTAFRALPDPSMYRNEHSALLKICSVPFRDSAFLEESSLLRHLLDHRDGSLGPWVPGRDYFEDELRAFGGGKDGLLPCVWDKDVPVFPQPIPLGTLLVDEMLVSIANIFAVQTENTRLQLLDLIESSNKSAKKQPWQSANATNTCVVLLGSLKAAVALRTQESEGEWLKRMQSIFQNMLAEEGSSPAHRRAAAEGLSLLARLGADAYAARLMRTLISDALTAQDPRHKGSIALALGCIHRSVGGMALSALVPATVQVLSSLARDAKDGFCMWSLHSLWLTIEAAGLTYVPHVQATLSLIMDILLSEEHACLQIHQSIGRLVNAIVAVIGPELLPGSSFFARCKTAVAEISSRDEPSALLECVLFTQQLVLFAPQAVSVHLHLETLRPTLSSKQPSLRQAAVSTLRHLSERDPAAMINENIEKDLFAMLDSETDVRIISTICLTLERLLEAACPVLPSRWLRLCHDVVLAYPKAENKMNSSAVTDNLGEDEGMMIKNEKTVYLAYQYPRYRTRVFAAECLSRIPTVVGLDHTHFDLARAKEQDVSDWLVLHLADLIGLAYQVATGTMESFRPIGVTLLDTILEKFDKIMDPDFAGHLLLEQYQAQFLSAARTALDPSSSPLVMAGGARLAAKIITSGVACEDEGILRRVVGLLSRPLSKWEDLSHPAYAEWVGSKVQSSLLGAHAAIKTYACACLTSNKNSVGTLLLSLLAKYEYLLHPCWLGLLQDYMMIRTQLAHKLQPPYVPFFKSVQSAAVASRVQPYLSEVCGVILQAVSVDVAMAHPDGSTSSQSSGPTVANFVQLWALAILLLDDKDSMEVGGDRYTRSFASFSGRVLHVDSSRTSGSFQIAALHAVQNLCAQNFYTEDMLSFQMFEEVIKIISKRVFVGNSWPSSVILHILQNVVTKAPKNYLEGGDALLLISEICINYVHIHMTREIQAKNCNTETTVALAIHVLDKLSSRLSDKDVLLPSFLSLGLQVMGISSFCDSVLTAALNLLRNVGKLISCPEEPSEGQFELDERSLVLASFVESLATLCESAWGRGSPAPHLSQMLDLVQVMAQTIPEADVDGFEGGLKFCVQRRCIKLFQRALSSRDSQAQQVALHVLKNVVQSGISEKPKGIMHNWAHLLMHALATDVTLIVYNVQEMLTAAYANCIGEALKLLLLLHSLVEGEDAQENVLAVLIPAAIAAVSIDSQIVQVKAALQSIVIKLITHLASLPETATQFKSVLTDLSAENRVKLQEIVKSTILQDNPASSLKINAGSVPLFPQFGKVLVAPIDTTTSQVIPQKDQESEEEWDDFEDEFVSSSNPNPDDHVKSAHEDIENGSDKSAETSHEVDKNVLNGDVEEHAIAED